MAVLRSRQASQATGGAPPCAPMPFGADIPAGNVRVASPAEPLAARRWRQVCRVAERTAGHQAGQRLPFEQIVIVDRHSQLRPPAAPSARRPGPPAPPPRVARPNRALPAFPRHGAQRTGPAVGAVVFPCVFSFARPFRFPFASAGGFDLVLVLAFACPGTAVRGCSAALIRAPRFHPCRQALAPARRATYRSPSRLPGAGGAASAGSPGQDSGAPCGQMGSGGAAALLAAGSSGLGAASSISCCGDPSRVSRSRSPCACTLNACPETWPVR